MAQALLLMPLFLLSDAGSLALLEVELDCRASGACLQNPPGAPSLAALRVLSIRDYLSMALEVGVAGRRALCHIMGTRTTIYQY